MTPHLSRDASYECIHSYDIDTVCQGGLWHFVTLVIYFATAKAELGAVLAAHFNYIAQEMEILNFVTPR